MDYCHSVLFCDESNLEIDDECLRIISSKSAPSTPLLQLYAPDTFSSISLPALVEFIRSTNFLRNASIFLSRVYGSRHKLITSFSPLIQPLDSEESLYDFQAIINVTEDVCVRLNIYNLEASAQD
uniref:Uncharacterized protein n=1 Tax=Panagrolaimus sp. ES5 TaxID=591445 RepID=A0AC34G6H9_9BILA